MCSDKGKRNLNLFELSGIRAIVKKNKHNNRPRQRLIPNPSSRNHRDEEHGGSHDHHHSLYVKKHLHRHDLFNMGNYDRGDDGCASKQRMPSRVKDAVIVKEFKRRKLRTVSIDLHGMTADLAFNEVSRFVGGAFHSGHRALLIVTGKGVHGNRPLRDNVERWVSLSPMVLWYAHKIDQDGDYGSIYVLLARQRD